jgi:crotonobetainyl-CoA:carnitine CoA-transferase CaiB-like acyl-CoA transferase
MRYQGSSLKVLCPPPGLGEHTDEILSELCGLSADAVQELREQGVFGPV